MSAIVVRAGVRYDENDSFEKRADDLTAYGGGEAVVLLLSQIPSREVLDRGWREVATE